MATTNTARSLSALILAGGRSSRMGQDKALVKVQGVALIQRVWQVALQCTPEIYVVTPWPERYQAILPQQCQFIQETLVPEASQSPGPLVGFAQGLAQVPTDWVLLLACDLPQLQSDILQDWIKMLDRVPEPILACLPKQAKGWEPLCGFYRRACLPALTAFIAQGGRSFQSWLAQHPVQELPLSNPQILFNCNTPNDLTDLNRLN